MMKQVSISEIPLEWDIYPPYSTKPDWSTSRPTWVEELGQFRAKVLAGWSANNERTDSDPFDGICYHLLAKHQGTLMGCVCLSRLLSRQELGMYFDSMEMESIGGKIHPFLMNTAVCGRWIVDPAFRTIQAAFRLVAGALVLGQSLGYSHILSVAGTKLGQDRILIRSGARPLEGFEPQESAKFGQPVRLLCRYPFNEPRNFKGMISIMQSELERKLEFGANNRLRMQAT